MYKQGGGEFRIRVNRFYTPSSVTSKENKSSVDAGYLNKKHPNPAPNDMRSNC